MFDIKRFLAALLALLMLAGCLAESDAFRSVYTYNYDYWEDIRESPDAYKVKTVLYSTTLELGTNASLGAQNVPMSKPQSLFVKEDKLYVCDTGNNRILEITQLPDAQPEQISNETPPADALPDEVPSETDASSEAQASAGTQGADVSITYDTQSGYRVRIIYGFTVDSKRIDPAYKAVVEARIAQEKAEQAAGLDDDTPQYDENGVEIEDEFEDVNSFDEFLKSVSCSFSGPSDISVDDLGRLYIADKSNYRVVVLDSELNFVKEFTRPNDATFDQNANFLPNRIVTDTSGRLYALADNVNKGIAKFEADTSFTGFIGANKVTMGMFEYIWKYFFLTDAQRSQTESIVPTRYENICIDPEGFIYATNTVFSEYDLKWDNAKPIRRINGIGEDILIKNDHYPPIGDLQWDTGNNNADYGPSKFVDITVLSDGIYVALDKTRGRLFGYDSQGIMLWAFGNRGNYEGSFRLQAAVSIEHMGNDLICLDQTGNCITVFTPTEYGQLIYDANTAYIAGDYNGSAELWRAVLRFNANYDMAFRGIGRALLRNEDYKAAMEYFEMAHDRSNYGRAFRLYRKDWVKENIVWIACALGALILLFVGRLIVKKMKMEVAMYERDHVAK